LQATIYPFEMWDKSEKFLQKDKHLGVLIKKWGHCIIKPIKKSLYFEDLVDAICSQQLSGKAASTIFGRVKKLLGGKISTEAILKKPDQELRNCGLSWAKVRYVKDLAENVKNGRLKVKKLDKLSDEEVIKELIAVKGIGRWTAEMFLMFSLGRPDIFPVDDLGIKKAISQLFNKSIKTIKKEELIKISNRWAPYRTVASWYLWRSLENR
jgi:DNA-3-methyladenine glycosylase II